LSAKPLVIVLIGPGGVGKGTIARALLAADERLWLSRSWTTRSIRPSEQGDEYVFVTRDEFEGAVAQDLFLEWASFNDNLYGTPRPTIAETRDLLLEIEVQGAQQVREHDPDAVVILVLPPSVEELEARLRGRGDSADHVERRLRLSSDEIEKGRALADFVVTNYEVAGATKDILSILESLRHSRRTGL
jgi:guanylate kinase